MAKFSGSMDPQLLQRLSLGAPAAGGGGNIMVGRKPIALPAPGRTPVDGGMAGGNMEAFADRAKALGIEDMDRARQVATERPGSSLGRLMEAPPTGGVGRVTGGGLQAPPTGAVVPRLGPEMRMPGGDDYRMPGGLVEARGAGGGGGAMTRGGGSAVPSAQVRRVTGTGGGVAPAAPAPQAPIYRPPLAAVPRPGPIEPAMAAPAMPQAPVPVEPMEPLPALNPNLGGGFGLDAPPSLGNVNPAAIQAILQRIMAGGQGRPIAQALLGGGQ